MKIEQTRLAAFDLEMNKLALSVQACRKLRGKQVIRDDEVQAFVDLLREWRSWKSGGDANPKVFTQFVERVQMFERRMQDRGYDRYRDVGTSWQAGSSMGAVPAKVVELAKKIPTAEVARELFLAAERNLRNALEAASRLPGWPMRTQKAAQDYVLTTQNYLNRVSGSIPISGPISEHDAQRVALIVLQTEKALTLIRQEGKGFAQEFLEEFQHAVAVILATTAKAIVKTAQDMAKELPPIPAWVPLAAGGIGLAGLAWFLSSRRQIPMDVSRMVR